MTATRFLRALLRLFVISAVLALAGCATSGGGAPPPASQGRVKVGVLLPMSGPGSAASVAKALKQAGELALFDFDNPNIELVTKDTLGTAEGARAAVEEALNEKVELLVGPLFAQEVSAAAPAARLAGIPMIAFSTDETVGGGGVYLLSFLAGRDVPRIVSFAATRGKRRFAAIIPETAYGSVVARAFERAVSRSDGQVVATAKFSPKNAASAKAAASRVAEAVRGGGVDALFLPIGQEEMPVLGPALIEAGLTGKRVTLLGTGRWDYPKAASEKALQGGWYPAADPKGWNGFLQRYSQTFGGTPPRIASLAYDAVSLAVALSSNPPGQRYTPDQLTRASGFAGVDGLFRLLPDGTSERGLAILQLEPGAPQVLDLAPSAFTAAQY